MTTRQPEPKRPPTDLGGIHMESDCLYCGYASETLVNGDPVCLECEPYAACPHPEVTIQTSEPAPSCGQSIQAECDACSATVSAHQLPTGELVDVELVEIPSWGVA
jgi:hypothetical protein